MSQIPLLILPIFLLFCVCKCDATVSKTCENGNSCNECIQMQRCAWCMQSDFNGKNRCLSINEASLCSEEYLYYPESESRISLNRVLLLDNEKVVQVRPQRISLSLRIDEELRISMRYYAVEGSSVHIKDNSSDPLKITYFSKCTNKDDALIATDKCEGLRSGDIVDFEIVVKATACPENLKDFGNIYIYPVGVNESLILDVQLHCNCSCEQPEHPLYEVNSEKCNNHGIYQCGICQCNVGLFGKQCECRNNEQMDCRSNISDKIDCSGHGVCVCGLCECDTRSNYSERFYGKYCECDNFSCERHKGLLCGGHGRCDCGQCLCASGWTGSACDCSTKG